MAELCPVLAPESVPRRVFKLALASESAAFQAAGKIESSLDKADGFIHLSDYTSAPTVAKMFFTTCTELKLIEVDASQFEGPVQWVGGSMGDASPEAEVLGKAKTTVHYWKKDGCVHVYGSDVTTSSIVREEDVPLGPDGVHVFPAWLNSEGYPSQ